LEGKFKKPIFYDIAEQYKITELISQQVGKTGTSNSQYSYNYRTSKK